MLVPTFFSASRGASGAHRNGHISRAESPTLPSEATGLRYGCINSFDLLRIGKLCQKLSWLLLVLEKQVPRLGNIAKFGFFT